MAGEQGLKGRLAQPLRKSLGAVVDQLASKAPNISVCICICMAASNVLDRLVGIIYLQ